MNGIKPTELTLLYNYIHDSREWLAKRGITITHITTKYSVITGLVTDISLHNRKLIKHFSTVSHPEHMHLSLYELVLAFLSNEILI